MNYTITTSDEEKLNVSICFDTFGNLYFDLTSVKDNKFFDEPLIQPLYQINVNGDNTPYIEPGIYPIVQEKKCEYTRFTLLNHNLEKKVKQSIEINQYNEDDEDDEDDEDSDDYYPEDNDYKEESLDSFYEVSFLDDDLLIKYGEHNKKFKFSNVNPVYNVPVNVRKFGDITSLYDTYIYKNEKLCFKSCSVDDEAIYRIRLLTKGEFWFRSIGRVEKLYNLVIDSKGAIKFN